MPTRKQPADPTQPIRRRTRRPRAIAPPDNPLARYHAHRIADATPAGATPRAAAALPAEDLSPNDDERRFAELRYEALRKAREKPAPTGVAARAIAVAGSSNWVQLGPLAIPNGQTYSTARVYVTGRITSLVIDPSNPQIIYVGAAQGGVWKTTDGGNHWTPLTDHEDSLSIGALAIDPNHPNVIYAATGEGNFSLDSYYGVGILKSTDGGQNWSQHGQALFFGASFIRLWVHPANSNLLFAAGNRGIIRSTTGGVSWQSIPPPGSLIATDVVIDPTQPNILYAAIDGNGIYKTDNATAPTPTWRKLSNGLPASGFGRIALAYAPSAPKTLFALLANADGNLITGFYTSSDAGNQWSRIPLPGGNIGGQGFYNLYVTVDPSTADTVYLCGISIWKATRSTTTGAWTIREIGSRIHSDNHALAFDPTNPRILYAGNDGGIYKSSDAGTSWSDEINHEICITQFEYIDQHPTLDTLVIGGTQDNGTEQFRNSPVFYHSDEGDGGYVAIDPTNPRIMWHGYYNVAPVALSTQAGQFLSWTDASEGLQTEVGLFYPPFAIDPTHPKNIVVGTDRLSLDANQGKGGWPVKLVLPGLRTNAQNRITEFVSALSYVNTNLIYAATSLGKVYRVSKAAGQNWTVRALHGDPLPSTFITDIATLPDEAQTVIVVTGGFGGQHVWQGEVAANGTTQWRSISGVGPGRLIDVPVNALVIDPFLSDVLYIGTDVGVFRTQDGGRNWAPYSDGLPNCAIFDLRLHPPTRLLRAATHGRGLWERSINDLPQPDVRLLVRHHLMDSGRIAPTQPATAAFGDLLRNIKLGDPLTHQQSPDIKIDRPFGVNNTYQVNSNEVDYLAFEAKLRDRAPQAGVVNRVYVQVHNRGIRAARNVVVKLLFADAAGTLTPLPVDFWQRFPNDASDTSQWHPIGAAQTIAELSPTEPKVLAWEWSLAVTASPQGYLLVVVDGVDDPILPEEKGLDVEVLARSRRQVGLRRV